MAVDMLLNIPGVKGESKVESDPKNQIDVLSWSWGMSNHGKTHVGSGGGSGKVDVQDVSLTKYVDSSSPKFMLACCKGSHFDNAVLTVRKAGGEKPVEYVKIKMTEVLITSVSTGGSDLSGCSILVDQPDPFHYCVYHVTGGSDYLTKEYNRLNRTEVRHVSPLH